MAKIIMNENMITAVKRLTGDHIMENIAAGETLRMSTTVEGEEAIFSETVPEGKEWSISIYLKIDETDV